MGQIKLGVNKSRLLIDMDGTLAKFKTVEKLETLYEPGYFRNLEPLDNVIKAIRKIIHSHPETEVFIMSAVLSDSKYALQEKNEWLDQYLPEIDLEHRIFPSCGENKLDYVPEGIRETDHLLDDYTANLMLWEPPAKGIKLLNGINHTHESWKGNMLRFDKRPEDLAKNILDIMEGQVIQDDRPFYQRVMIANRDYDKKLKSGYITEAEKSQLDFLTKDQAYRAIQEGLHICCVNDSKEYQGVHAEDYSAQELGDIQKVSELYNTVGTGIVHRAFLSPYYDNAGELKAILQKECAERKELKKQTELKAPKL